MVVIMWRNLLMSN